MYILHHPFSLRLLLKFGYFCRMKWIGERISFVDDKQKTTIVIEPQKKGLVTGLMGAWFSMWIVIGATVIWSYYTFTLTQQEQIIVYVFMAFWLYYAIRVGRSFFWLMWGKELIKIDEVSLTYKRSIRKYGRATSYLVDNIAKIRMYVPKERSFQAVWENSPWVRGGERIEFDYMGKVVRFGRKLDQKDAEQLFKFITKKVEQRVRKLNK